MKKIALLILALILALTLAATPTWAASIDPEYPSSLTVRYSKGDESFEGLQISTYRVIEVDSEGRYSLTGVFSDLPVRVQGITSRDEWRQVTSTLAAYVVADGITPTAVQTTDENGFVKFESILPGMYLTLGVRSEKDGTVTVFEDFLTAVPDPSKGTPEYHVTAYPKCEQHISTPENVEYKIVKQWKDIGNADRRPESVSIDIFKDGELWKTELLSAENEWCCEWSAPDDGSVWHAVERDIDEIYTVTVETVGNTIIVTNVYDAPETPPQLGDTSSLAPYVLVMSLGGIILLLLAVGRRRREL